MADLGELLRAWRDRIQPAGDSPFVHQSRRAPGMRREEVAELASVSADYVKRLEQGRSHPSREVLRSLARALRVSDNEYELACRLAGYATEYDTQIPQHVGPGVQRMLDRLGDLPVAVFDAAWTRIDQNALWSALTGDERGNGSDRTANIVWRTFLGDPGPIQHHSLDAHKHSLVADIRQAAIRYPNDAELATMIDDLRTSSDEFARLWDVPAVPDHGTADKTLDHPRLGTIELNCDVLSVHGADLRIIVFSAAPGSAAAAKLTAIRCDAATASTPQ